MGFDSSLDDVLPTEQVAAVVVRQAWTTCTKRATAMQSSPKSPTSTNAEDTEDEVTEALLAEFIDMMVAGCPGSELDSMLEKYATNDDFVRLARISRRLRSTVSKASRQSSVTDTERAVKPPKGPRVRLPHGSRRDT